MGRLLCLKHRKRFDKLRNRRKQCKTESGAAACRRLLFVKDDYMPIFKYCTACKKLTQYNGKSLCPDCEAKRQIAYNKNKRDVKADRFYHSKQWKSLSKAVLAKAGYKCALCGGLAVEVHHIKDIRSHPELSLDVKNLMPLCTACHNAQR